MVWTMQDVITRTWKTVLKVDIDQFEEIAAMYNVRVVPTLILFKDGANLAVSTGFKPVASLERFVDTAF